MSEIPIGIKVDGTLNSHDHEFNTAPSPESIAEQAALASHYMSVIFGKIPGAKNLWKVMEPGHFQLWLSVSAEGVTYSVIAYRHEEGDASRYKMHVSDGNQSDLELRYVKNKGTVTSGTFAMTNPGSKIGASLKTQEKRTKLFLKPLMEGVPEIKADRGEAKLPDKMPYVPLPGERQNRCGAFRLTGSNGEPRKVNRPGHLRGIVFCTPTNPDDSKPSHSRRKPAPVAMETRHGTIYPYKDTQVVQRVVYHLFHRAEAPVRDHDRRLRH